MLINALKTLRAVTRPNIHSRIWMYFCLLDNLMSRQKKSIFKKVSPWTGKRNKNECYRITRMWNWSKAQRVEDFNELFWCISCPTTNFLSLRFFRLLQFIDILTRKMSSCNKLRSEIISSLLPIEQLQLQNDGNPKITSKWYELQSRRHWPQNHPSKVKMQRICHHNKKMKLMAFNHSSMQYLILSQRDILMQTSSFFMRCHSKKKRWSGIPSWKWMPLEITKSKSVFPFSLSSYPLFVDDLMSISSADMWRQQHFCRILSH